MVVTRPKFNLSYVLTTEEVQRAASMFDVDESVLSVLNLRGLLNAEYIKDSLMIEDYFKLTRGLTDISEAGIVFTIPEVKRAIAIKHHSTPHHLNKVLNCTTKRPLFSCNECGKIISESEFNRTGGLCSDCMSQKIINQRK